MFSLPEGTPPIAGDLPLSVQCRSLKAVSDDGSQNVAYRKAVRGTFWSSKVPDRECEAPCRGESCQFRRDTIGEERASASPPVPSPAACALDLQGYLPTLPDSLGFLLLLPAFLGFAPLSPLWHMEALSVCSPVSDMLREGHTQGRAIAGLKRTVAMPLQTSYRYFLVTDSREAWPSPVGCIAHQRPFP